MGDWIELKAEGAGPISAWRIISGWRASGRDRRDPEIFGVNTHDRAVADRFASEGYLAVAPAIFDHVETSFDLSDEPARGRKAS